MPDGTMLLKTVSEQKLFYFISQYTLNFQLIRKHQYKVHEIRLPTKNYKNTKSYTKMPKQHQNDLSKLPIHPCTNTKPVYTISTNKH